MNAPRIKSGTLLLLASRRRDAIAADHGAVAAAVKALHAHRWATNIGEDELADVDGPLVRTLAQLTAALGSISAAIDHAAPEAWDEHDELDFEIQMSRKGISSRPINQAERRALIERWHRLRTNRAAEAVSAAMQMENAA